MIDLLKSKKTNSPFEKPSPETAQENAEKNSKKEKPVNINRYKDLEGLTVGKMELGFWFVKNRTFFVKSFFVLLGIIGFVTWSLFFFTFGKYLLFDIKTDRQNMIKFVETGSVDHQKTLSLLPKNLIIESVQLFSNQDGIYDFAINVTNPNPKHFLVLSFVIEYDKGETRVVDDVILPSQNKYLLVTGHKADSRPRNLSFVYKSKKFQRLSGDIVNRYESFRDDRLDFVFSEKNFSQGLDSGLSEKIVLNNLSFDVENKSAYNYWEVPLNIMLFSNAKLLAVKNYTIDNFMSEEEKTINIVVPGNVGRVQKIEIQPGINIFDERVYMEFEGERKESIIYE